MCIQSLSVSVLAFALAAGALVPSVNARELSAEENARCRAVTEVTVTMYDGLLVVAMLSGDRVDKQKVKNIQAVRDDIANNYLPLFASAPPPSEAEKDKLVGVVPLADLFNEVLACGAKAKE